MRRKLEFVALILLLISLIVISNNLAQYVSSSEVVQNKTQVVLDPGHGDSDPGKVGINGVLEKNVNLKISKEIKNLLEGQGIEVLMTREGDESLAKESDTNKKVQDMKARVQLMNGADADLIVSIHQNSYTDEQVHGAQVFYYAHSENGKACAEIMQKALLEADPDNTRQAKADDSYYILRRTKSPTIIVECGFLSNPEEAEQLNTEEYQKKLAKAITQGIMACLSK